MKKKLPKLLQAKEPPMATLSLSDIELLVLMSAVQDTLGVVAHVESERGYYQRLVGLQLFLARKLDNLRSI